MTYYEIIDGYKILHYQQAGYLRFVREHHKLTHEQGYRVDRVQISNRGVQVYVSSPGPSSGKNGDTDDKDTL